MTVEEFGKIKFKYGMAVTINGQNKNIVSVDFQKNLIGLEIKGDKKKIDWVRCEHCELIPSTVLSPSIDGSKQ